MICPRCQTLIADDAVICESCDFIIDTKFLGENITNEDDAPKPSGDRTRVRAVGAQPTPAAVDPVDPLEVRDEYVAMRPSAFTRIAAPPASVNEAVYDLTETFKSFGLNEKLSAGGAIAFLFSLGLPWRWTEVDEGTIGLLTWAGWLSVTAAIVCTASFMRRRGFLRPYVDSILLVSTMAALATLAFTIVFRLGSVITVSVSMAGKLPVDVEKMHPEFGLYVGLLAAIVMTTGALWTFADRKNLST